MILVGDVGGTKTRLALYEHRNGNFELLKIETFSSRDFAGLEGIVQVFLHKHQSKVQKACFGIPGPVVKGKVQATNLPWAVSEESLKSSLKIGSVKLINDLVATAAAVPYLKDNQLITLHAGSPDPSDIQRFAVLAPGTGLGQAFLQVRNGKIEVFPSEGGHVDFAPTDEIQIELLHYLLKKFKRVSYERVVCGPGLVNIYDFLKDTGRAEEPSELRKKLKEEDPAAVISYFGQTKEYEICVKALDIFVSALGAQAGNLALTFLANNGVYLGGGIPPKITRKLSDGTLVASYLNKGRLSTLVEKTPLYAILDDHVALLGAARLALE